MLSEPHADRVCRERDLFRALVGLAYDDDPALLLSSVLRLVRQTVRAEVGYVELTDDNTGRQQIWSEHYGLDSGRLGEIRDRVSRGIIGAARTTGETIHVPSALLDDRFATRTSVREGEIEAVLCVPIVAEGLSGVLYLQGRLGGGVFEADDVECCQVVARFVASQARLLLELLLRRSTDDATAPVRERLRADTFMGRSRTVAKLLQRLEVVARMEENVLLTGPPGSGKSTLARVLHDNSRRAAAPFIEINAPSIGEGRLEVELFGAVPGAYTGAPPGGLPGKVMAAEGGTLFLDEIGEVSAEIQVKLLQFLQTKRYFPVGGTTARLADVRIVAATNAVLDVAVEQGRFRRDLRDRLQGVELRCPALDLRRDDIPVLAQHFCREFCSANRLNPMTLSLSALAHLEFAPWPGNVRELMNRVRDAIVSATMDGASLIELRHLFADEGRHDEEGRTFRGAREQWERTFLASALRDHDWNVSSTAVHLELARSFLNAKIKRYGLRRGENA